VSSAGTSRLGVQFVGKPWDDVRSIPVDRAGEHIFSLRPRTEQYVERISCDVTVEDNIKVVTLRSTYTVHNETLYPLEVLLVDDAGQPVVKAAQKIGQCGSQMTGCWMLSTTFAVPGETYSLPIDSVARHHIRVQPDRKSFSLPQWLTLTLRDRWLRLQVVLCAQEQRVDFEKGPLRQVCA
jgi:vacuolar protein sorting-associated protein 13A/C